MAEIRNTADMPVMDAHQWQNFILQVDTLTETNLALVADKAALALAIDQQKQALNTTIATLTQQLADAKAVIEVLGGTELGKKMKHDAAVIAAQADVKAAQDRLAALNAEAVSQPMMNKEE